MKAILKETNQEVKVYPDHHEQGSYLDLDTWERYYDYQLIIED